MATTKLNNLIDPIVIGDTISTEIEAAIKFAPLAEIDDTLKERAGSTVKVPQFVYIGDATDVAEGAPIDMSLLTATSKEYKVKKAAKGVEITDEALLSGYGDPEGEAKDQLKISIAQKLDNDCIEALKTIPEAMTVDKKATEINAKIISDALVKFGEAIDDPMVLLIAPQQLSDLRTSPDFVKPSELGDKVLMSGVIGAIYGAQIVVSNKIKKDTATSSYTNFIVKKGAIAIFRKRDVETEAARDIVHKKTMLTADQHYVVGLKNQSKAIKLITKAL